MVPSEPTWHVSRVQKRVSKFVKLKLDFLLKFPGKYLGDNSPDLPTYRTNLFHRQTRCDAPNLMQMAQGGCEKDRSCFLNVKNQVDILIKNEDVTKFDMYVHES